MITRNKQPCFTLVFVRTIVKTECDLLDLSFIPVDAVALCLLPTSIHVLMSPNDLAANLQVK